VIEFASKHQIFGSAPSELWDGRGDERGFDDNFQTAKMIEHVLRSPSNCPNCHPSQPNNRYASVNAGSNRVAFVNNHLETGTTAVASGVGGTGPIELPLQASAPLD
jgi:hypothetical protein